MNSRAIPSKIILAVLLLSHPSKAQEKINSFKFETAITSDFATNISGGNHQGSVYLGNIDLIMTFDTDKGNLWPGGIFFVYGLNNHGNPISPLVGDIQGTDNIEARTSTRLYQLWYQQQIANFSLTIGQHDLNSIFASTETGSTFINSSFGIQPDISANVPVSIFPVAAFGGIIKWDISNKFNFQAAVYDGDPGDQIDNPHSLDWSLNKEEGLLTIYELQYKHVKDSVTTGTYKIGAWHHTADVITYNHSANGHKNNQGLYFIADQQIYRKVKNRVQSLNMFIQLGLAPKACNLIDAYAGMGLRFHGLLASREEDDLGIAIGHASLSHEIIEADSLNLLQHETVIELTYRAVLSPNFTIQPDLQYVISPGGSTLLQNALVGIMRLHVEF